MQPNMLVSTITAIAVALAERKESQEIDLLAAIFTQLGDTLATIAATQDLTS